MKDVLSQDLMIQFANKNSMSTRSESIMAEDNEASSVEELLQEAMDSNQKKVCLDYKGLTCLPVKLVENEHTFSHVEHLHLKRNLIITLPVSIGNLNRLVELNLHSNRLISLPDEISHLTSLQSLDISNNQLMQLPSALGQLKSLCKLFISNNQINSLPKELGNLENLSILEASCNRLTSLPVELSQCHQLHFLNFLNNNLEYLPRQLTSLKVLKELIVSGNRLKYLPTDLGLCQPHLRTVFVDDNPLLFALPFGLWMKKLGATGCGTGELSAEQKRCMNVFKENNMSAILPHELRDIKQSKQLGIEVSPLLEIALKAAYQYKDKIDLQTLPRSLSELVTTPTAHCIAPSCYEKPIFCTAWVHLLKLDWAQPWQQTQDSIGFVGLCCSRECLRVFQKIPVRTF